MKSNSIVKDDELLCEIQGRLPLPCSPVARVSRHVLLVGSVKERFRDELIGELEKQNTFSTLEEVMVALGGNINDRDEKKKLTEAENLISDVFDKVSSKATSKERMKKLKNDFHLEILSPLKRKFGSDVCFEKPSGNTDFDSYDFETDETEKLSRINVFFRPSEAGFSSKMRWETFDHSHNFTCFEEIKKSKYEALEKEAQIPESDVSFDNLMDRAGFGEFFSRSVEERKRDSFSSFIGRVYQGRGDDDQALKSPVTVEDSNLIKDFVKKGGGPLEGELLVSSHVWVAPIKWFLENQLKKMDLPELEEGIKEALENVDIVKRIRNYAYKANIHNLSVDEFFSSNSAEIEEDYHARAVIDLIGRYAQTWFGHREGSADWDDDTIGRPDFVFSFVVGGRAIILTDMRQSNEWDKASRTLIIDLNMNDEQRGRLVSRYLDLATFRVLGLRGLPYVDAAIDVLTKVGIQLNVLDSQPHIDKKTQRKLNLLKSKIKRRLQFPKPVLSMASMKSLKAKKTQIEQSNEFSSLEKAHTKLRTLSKGVDRLNLFFTYGITGREISTVSYSEQMKELVEGLREIRIEGWQTIDEYTRRYHASAADIGRLGQRYANMRTRIVGALSLLRSELNVLELKQLRNEAVMQGNIMNKTFWTAALTFLVALVTLANSGEAWENAYKLINSFKEQQQQNTQLPDQKQTTEQHGANGDSLERKTTSE